MYKGLEKLAEGKNVMIQKLNKPILFDEGVNSVIIARDGEKFYVCERGKEKEVDDQNLNELTDLLSWAILNNYPISKFVSAQRKLSAKFEALL